jgi:hypothetical protein
VADAPSQVASSVETNKNVRQRLGKERRKEDVPEASRASAKTRPRDAIPRTGEGGELEMALHLPRGDVNRRRVL